jgi:hypothetical protein
MTIRSPFRGGLLLVAAVLSSPSRSDAQILITHGDAIKHIGDVKTNPLQGQPLPANKVGFKYSHFGVFWADLWTWDGTYCLYSGNDYWALQPAEAAALLGVRESELSKPFLYTFPLGLLILVPLCLLGILMNAFKKQQPSEDPLAHLFQDPRYQTALSVLSERYAKQEASEAMTTQPAPGPGAGPKPDKVDAAFEAGVQSLVDQGIPRNEAERNLGLMVHSLMAAKNEAPPPDVSQ